MRLTAPYGEEQAGCLTHGYQPHIVGVAAGVLRHHPLQDKGTLADCSST